MSPDVELFLESIKTAETKTKYNSYLRKYMEKYDVKERHPRLIEGNLIRYIVNLKNTKSFSAVNNYLSPVITFYKIELRCIKHFKDRRVSVRAYQSKKR